MTLQERLLAIATALPSDTSAVTLSRTDLLALLSDEQVTPPTGRDLTVEEVAAETCRAPSTVRGWLISGELRGYKLNRRDWRVTRSALRQYLEAQRAQVRNETVGEGGKVDISAWRRLSG